MGTFGSDARYEDEPWCEEHTGLAGVRGYYETLLGALPDLRIDVQRRFGSADAVAYETVISGIHLGPWRGIPATGRQVSFPLVAVYTFTPDHRLRRKKLPREAVVEAAAVSEANEAIESGDRQIGERLKRRILECEAAQ